MSFRRLLIPLGLALTPILCASGPLGAADTPPANLRFVDGHWTAWQPPRDLPAGVPVHIVVRGDTLWDLAQRYLGNPYLWPQIWERNQYVLDAHWIYPGDPLLLGIEPEQLATTEVIGGPGSTEPASGEALSGVDAANGSAGGSASGAGSGAAGEGGARGGGFGPDGLDIEPSADSLGPPAAFGFETDLLCSGFISDVEESLPYRITGSEHQAYATGLNLLPMSSGSREHWAPVTTLKYGLDLSDIVYLDGGRSAGLSPGDLLTVVQPAEKLRHPRTREVLGRHHRTLGRVRVLSVQADSAIGEIAHACAAIPVGSRLRAYVAEPVPLGRRSPERPVNDPPTIESLDSAPSIVYAQDGIISIGEDHLVWVDLGADQVVPGDVFTIYRRNRPGFPPLPVGELAVLSVGRTTALSRVISSRLPIYVGDPIERK